MDVDRGQGRQRVVGERFHPVHQPAHTVGLFDDQLRQRHVLCLGTAFEQLCRAADACQRVLDFMRQHAPQSHQRPQARDFLSAPLTAHTVPDAEVQQHRPVPQRDRSAIGLERWQAKQADVNAALPDPGVFLDRPVQQRHQR